MTTSTPASAWAYRSLSELSVGFKWGLVLGLAVSWASMLLVAYVGPLVQIPLPRGTRVPSVSFSSSDFGSLRTTLLDPYVLGIVGVALVADSVVGIRYDSAWSGILAGLLLGFVTGTLLAPTSPLNPSA